MSRFETALEGVGREARERLLLHLKEGTSSEWISDWLKRAGFKVSPSTIRAERRRMLNAGE